ncbi:MAG: hypothetical protein RL235_354 [Chlamydiota bacterium]|jgi:tetratricopeptide (TPR) repeat protein
MNKTYLLLFVLSLTSCYRVADRLDPRVDFQIQDSHFARSPSPFQPLNIDEKATEWGKEMTIAKAFAEELDLYRAVSTYKRAHILLTDSASPRKAEIEYDILLSYFLGGRFDEAIGAFDKSSLAHVDATFPAHADMLLVLYECYREVDDKDKELKVIELLAKENPETAEKLCLSRSIREGNLNEVTAFADGFRESSYLSDLLNNYAHEKKSVATAQCLNALVPGAGYLYIGQKKSAFTALLLNGLFITAAYQFFHRGNIAAGIITSGFEAGWYFGGIYGAGEEAKYYNERLYEQRAQTVLNEHALFPALMMQYSY